MEKLKCIAIDDEPLALDLIRQYVAKFPSLQLLNSFEDAISGAEFLRKHVIDLVFVDINMPDISGLDLVRSLEVKPMIIFTTAHKKFAYEGFELDALDYLLKPIDFNRFSKTISKAIEYNQYKKNPRPAESDSLYVYSEYQLIRIPLPEIVYIESNEDYLTIHQLNDKPVSTLMTLKKMLEKLPAAKFKRIHRSFIVSLQQLKSLHNRKVQLRTGIELPVGDSYMQSLQDSLK
jgi:two-component system, LytTR family, response regulator